MQGAFIVNLLKDCWLIFVFALVVLLDIKEFLKEVILKQYLLKFKSNICLFSLNLIINPLKTVLIKFSLITVVKPTPEGLTEDLTNNTSPLFKLYSFNSFLDTLTKLYSLFNK